MNGDRDLIIDPDIVGYALRSHNYDEMSPMDQVRLNIIRLEIDRIRVEVQRHLLRNLNDIDRSSRPRCPICLDYMTPYTQATVANCGHMFCFPCIRETHTQSGPACRCPVCRLLIIDLMSSTYRVYLRFNFDMQIVCRRCTRLLTVDVHTFRMRCGDVYCRECVVILNAHRDSTCYGCGFVVENNRQTRMHIAYT